MITPMAGPPARSPPGWAGPGSLGRPWLGPVVAARVMVLLSLAHVQGQALGRDVDPPEMGADICPQAPGQGYPPAVVMGQQQVLRMAERCRPDRRHRRDPAGAGVWRQPAPDWHRTRPESAALTARAAEVENAARTLRRQPVACGQRSYL